MKTRRSHCTISDREATWRNACDCMASSSSHLVLPIGYPRRRPCGSTCRIDICAHNTSLCSWSDPRAKVSSRCPARHAILFLGPPRWGSASAAAPVELESHPSSRKDFPDTPSCFTPKRKNILSLLPPAPRGPFPAVRYVSTQHAVQCCSCSPASLYYKSTHSIAYLYLLL